MASLRPDSRYPTARAPVGAGLPSQKPASPSSVAVRSISVAMNWRSLPVTRSMIRASRLYPALV